MELLNTQTGAMLANAFLDLPPQCFPIDLRSPKEFQKSSLPNTVNIPILNDEERHLVGLAYKEKGEKEAVHLGLTLTEKNKSSTVQSWQAHLAKQKKPILLCWRGGLRSRIAQSWLAEQNTPCQRVEGGYKEIRKQLLSILEQSFSGIVLSGATGSRKTLLLQKFQEEYPKSAFIDLEGIAAHKGSAFGSLINKEQPLASNFENSLAYTLYKNKNLPLLLENESRSIGRTYLPNTFFHHFSLLPKIELEVPIETRIQNIYKDYILKDEKDYPQEIVRQHYSNALDKLYKSLGSQRYKEIKDAMSAAFDNNDPIKHCHWIERILKEHYDPCYEFSSKRTKRKILFSGNREEVYTFLENQILTVPHEPSGVEQTSPTIAL